MSSHPRTGPAAHRASYRGLPVSEIDWRLVAPAARRTLDRVAVVSSVVGRVRQARVDMRALVITGLASSVATGSFLLGAYALFR